MVQKVVYNDCFGGWGYVDDVTEWVRENEQSLEQEYEASNVKELASQTMKGEMYDDGSGIKELDTVFDVGVSRNNTLLADIIEGKTEYDGEISKSTANLKVAAVPDGVEWTIKQHDGKETVKEKARTFS